VKKFSGASAQEEADRLLLGWRVAVAMRAENYLQSGEYRKVRKMGSQSTAPRRYVAIRTRAIQATARNTIPLDSRNASALPETRGILRS